ncbi:unnamed protein product [Hymenolepis diminuta]|uniref:DUF5727 domain-containing protein n=1 Tax=Hymenolepis diminuta TaxID=6216 RepID=A0A0R3SAW7_HYMDI|nr:unnamed protein product [Hymenolepis diminuta]
MYVLKFSRICLYISLLLLALQRVALIPFSSDDAEDEEEDIPGTNEEFNRFIKNKTKTFCTCGTSVLQRRFCNLDFAIVARKSGKAVNFYRDPEYEGLNFGGLVIPVNTQHVLRGSMKVNSTIDLHYIQGFYCGVDSKSVPDDDKPFLITGFQYKFLKHRKKAENSTLFDRESKELLLVTSCSDSIQLDSLTYTQIAGVFLNYYCSDISLEVKQIPFVL